MLVHMGHLDNIALSSTYLPENSLGLVLDDGRLGVAHRADAHDGHVLCGALSAEFFRMLGTADASATTCQVPEFDLGATERAIVGALVGRARGDALELDVQLLPIAL